MLWKISRFSKFLESTLIIKLKIINLLRMKKVCLFLFTLLTSAMASSQMQKSTYRIQPFPLSDVRLLDSPFRHAEDLDIQYLLELNADRLLAPYRKEAGLAPKAPNYTNWGKHRTRRTHWWSLSGSIVANVCSNRKCADQRTS